MKSIFRWEGIVFFLIVSACITAFVVIFSGPLAERAIEQGGTELVGAKVDLADADVGFFPLGLELSGLQVTNPDEPMTNLVQVDRISFHLEAENFFARKIIVDEMAVTGVRFNTERKSSGAVKTRRKVLQDESGAGKRSVKNPCGESELTLPKFDIPDVKNLLASEELQSVKRARQLQNDIEQSRAAFTEKINSLPGKKDFAKYNKRIEKLKSSSRGGLAGTLSGAGELQQVRSEVERDLAKIKEMKGEYQQVLARYKKELSDLSHSAAGEDIKRLQEKYGLSGASLKNFSQKFLGSKLCNKVHGVLTKYEKIEPLVEKVKQKQKEKGPQIEKPLRAKGVDVRFKEENPLPDFLIRLAQVSLVFDFGTISGQVKNITPQQPLLGKPLTFSFAGEKLDQLARLSLDGSIDRTKPLKSVDVMRLSMQGYKAGKVVLSDSASMPISLNHALADIDINARMESGTVASTVNAALQSVALAVAAQDDASAPMNVLAQTLESVKEMNVTADISGTVENYAVSIASDIDDSLAKALNKQVGKAAKQFEKELKKSVTQKLNTELAGTRQDMALLDGLGGDFSERLQLGDNILKNLLKGGDGIKLPF